MKRILLLGVGGNVSQGILKAIRNSELDIYVVGACVSEYSSGLYLCDEAVISPFANSNDFISWVIDICNKKNIDMIMTGVEENIIVLSKNINVIKNNTKAIFISSSFDQLKIGQDKLQTCKWLKNNGCNYPLFCSLSDANACIELVDKVGYPLIAKPNNGKSASGIRIVNDKADLEEIIGKDEYVLEECLPENTGEYTVGCYCDKNGIAKDIIIMQRRLKKGTTVYAKVIRNKLIEQEARKIVDKYKPIGPLNIQMRFNKHGEPVCFELNVRFSGSTAMRTNFGYKDVKAMIKEYLYNEAIDDCFSVTEGECFRYDNEFFLFNDSVEQMKRTKQVINQANTIYFDDNLKKRNN